MPIGKIKEFLDGHNTKYVVMSHSQAYTAQEIAASAHIPGKEMAKTVMIKIDGKMAMAVLPSTYKVDFKLLKETTGATNVKLADEDEFKDMFPDCEVGAMPPFGNLYEMEVLVSESLAEDDEIVFSAGSHQELIKLKYKDFERLTEPKIAKFSFKSM